MGTAQKIIFLDFDGPVIPWKYQIAFSHIPHSEMPADAAAVHLISSIAKRTGAKIVISSQKRNLGKDTFLKEFIRYGFDPELLHDDWAIKETGNRLKDIKEYIERHPEITHWIAIDDEALDTDNLVMASPADGFLIQNYDEALRKLGVNTPRLGDLFYWKARLGFEGPPQEMESREVQNAIARLKIPGRQP